METLHVYVVLKCYGSDSMQRKSSQNFNSHWLRGVNHTSVSVASMITQMIQKLSKPLYHFFYKLIKFAWMCLAAVQSGVYVSDVNISIYYHPSVANSPSVANHALASQQLNDSL